MGNWAGASALPTGAETPAVVGKKSWPPRQDEGVNLCSHQHSGHDPPLPLSIAASLGHILSFSYQVVTLPLALSCFVTSSHSSCSLVPLEASAASLSPEFSALYYFLCPYHSVLPSSSPVLG